MSRYSGISKAKIVESGNYIRPGLSLLLEISRVYEIAPGFNLKNYAFAAEFAVVECKATAANAEPHGVDEIVSFFREMDPSKEQMWLPDVKAFMLAALGLSHKRNPALIASIPDADLDALTQASVGEANPLEGVQVYCDTIGKPTRPTVKSPQGGTFTKHMWGPDADRSAQWSDTKRLVLAGAKTTTPEIERAPRSAPVTYTNFANGYGLNKATNVWDWLGKTHPEYLGADK